MSYRTASRAGALALAGLLVAPAGAATFQWTNAFGDENFNLGANWSPTIGAPPGAGDVALFNVNLADDTVYAANGTAIDVLEVFDTAVVDLTIGGGTGQMDLDNAFISLLTGDSFGDTAQLNLRGGRLDTLHALIRNQTIIQVTGLDAYWDSANVGIQGDTFANTAAVSVSNQAKIITHGQLTVGGDTNSGRALVDGTTAGFGLVRANWTVAGNTTVGPAGNNGFNFGDLTVRNNGDFIGFGNVTVSGTDDVESVINVETGGFLDSNSTLHLDARGTLNLSGTTSRVEAGAFTKDALGTFNWTSGTLEITDSALILSTEAPDSVFGSAMTVGAGQTLVLSDPSNATLTDGFRIGGLGSGVGSLIIENGGQIQSLRTAMGTAVNSVGTATVRGAGSSWLVGEELRVGEQGSAQGTLTIQSQGEVIANSCWIGLGATASGHAIVNGAGSSLEAIEHLSIGNQGSAQGLLEVQAGGVAVGNQVLIGSLDSGNGTVHVDGAGSRLQSTDYTGVGGNNAEGGTGLLRVTNGGEVVVGTTLYAWNDATIELIDGSITARSFVVQVPATINHDGGTLTIDGGTFDPKEERYAIGGSAMPTMRLINGAQAHLNQYLDVGYQGEGRLEILSNSDVSLGTTNEIVEIGRSPGNTGELLVAGLGTTYQVMGTSDLYVGSLGAGMMEVRNQAQVNIGDLLVVGYVAPGTLVVDNASLTVGGESFIGRVAGSDGSSVTVHSATWNAGQIVWVGGGNNVDGAGGTAELIVGPGGNVVTNSDIKVWGPGRLILEGGTVSPANRVNLIGSLSGSGLINADLYNNGTVIVGQSIGLIEVAGQYDQQLARYLEIELSGDTTPGIDFDQLMVQGAANLDGEIGVLVIGQVTPYVPVPVLSSQTAVNGTFATVFGVNGQPGLAPQEGMAVTYTNTEVLVTRALLGDTDLDGDVDDADLGEAFSRYTGPGGIQRSWSDGDADGDGDVDDSDLGDAFSNYTGPLGPSVPEPASLVILAGLIGVLTARRR